MAAEAAAQSPATDRAATAPYAKQLERSQDPYLSGRGGKDHKYLQHLIRAAAHERGFKADIEFEVPGGAVDVAIEASGRRIACEIAITTDAEHEAGNIRKCLAAGFDEVWIIVASERKKVAFAKSLNSLLCDASTSVLTADEAIALLETRMAHEPSAKSVRGYAVKVRHSDLGAEETRRKREAIASILARSLRGS